MIELRQYVRRSHSGHVIFWNEHVTQLQGSLKNMSEGGGCRVQACPRNCIAVL